MGECMTQRPASPAINVSNKNEHLCSSTAPEIEQLQFLGSKVGPTFDTDFSAMLKIARLIPVRRSLTCRHISSVNTPEEWDQLLVSKSVFSLPGLLDENSTSLKQLLTCTPSITAEVCILMCIVPNL